LIALLFGSSKLPGLARSLGEASREFKKGATDASAPADASAPDEEPPELPGPSAPPASS
jgi:TatA/E family protein of Tat protein translocase